MTATDAKPAAVWDPYAPDAVGDPPSSWRTLREGCPVAWSERSVLSPGGFWAVSRYDDVVSLVVAADRFNNSGGPQFGKGRPPLEVDRPEHTFYRRILHPYFANARVEQLESRIRAFVAEMLAPVIEAGGGDLAEQLTYPLPARTPVRVARASRLGMGVPKADLGRAVRRRGGAWQRSGDGQALCRARWMSTAGVSSTSACENPRDPELDLISGIIGKTDGERTVTADDAVQLVRLLLVAGHNSTTSALGNCIMRIAADHGLQTRLRSAPELVAAAVDELLRLETPVQAVPRWAAQDAVVAGRPIRAGEKLMLLLASANRDPGQFPDRTRACSTAGRTGTSPSGAGSIAASAQIWRGSSSESPARNCSPGRSGCRWPARRRARRS